MYAVIVRCEKDNVKDEIAYIKTTTDHIHEFLGKDVLISFVDGNCRGEIFLFDTEEEAEKNMGAK